MDDGELQQAYREATSRVSAGRGGCPSADDLIHGLTGAASRRERQALAAHLARCSDCAEEYRIAAELEPWAEAAGRRSPAEPAPPPPASTAGADGATARRWWLWPFDWRRGAAVAAFVVLAVSGVALWQRTSPAPAPDRGPGSAMLLVRPPDRSVLPEPPARLSWSAMPGAEGYRVVLYDVEASPIWESAPIEDPGVSLPEMVRSGMQPDRPYYWRVIVSTGIDERSSDLFRFTVRPR